MLASLMMAFAIGAALEEPKNVDQVADLGVAENRYGGFRGGHVGRGGYGGLRGGYRGGYGGGNRGYGGFGGHRGGYGGHRGGWGRRRRSIEEDGPIEDLEAAAQNSRGYNSAGYGNYANSGSYNEPISSEYEGHSGYGSY